MKLPIRAKVVNSYSSWLSTEIIQPSINLEFVLSFPKNTKLLLKEKNFQKETNFLSIQFRLWSNWKPKRSVIKSQIYVLKCSFLSFKLLNNYTGIFYKLPNAKVKKKPVNLWPNLFPSDSLVLCFFIQKSRISNSHLDQRRNP